MKTTPDFIIIGAMKSGTTSLHHILNNHSKVFIPNGEVQLFSVDDIQQNPVFFRFVDGKWTYQSFEEFTDKYTEWYESLYEESKPDQILGEDSPTYLPSRKAIDRIREYLPDVKIIIMLRDPVARVYSHYWHWVRTYRAIYPLEDTIQFQHGNLLQRGLYEEQVRNCMKMFSHDQIQIVIFEDFVDNQQEVVDSVLKFLGLEREDILSKTDRHKNEGKYPKSLSLALWRNRIFRDLYGQRYRNNIDWMPSAERLPWYRRVLLRAVNHINPMCGTSPEPMKPETKDFLSKFFSEKNSGLSDLINRNLEKYWPTFR